MQVFNPGFCKKDLKRFLQFSLVALPAILKDMIKEQPPTFYATWDLGWENYRKARNRSLLASPQKSGSKGHHATWRGLTYHGRKNVASFYCLYGRRLRFTRFSQLFLGCRKLLHCIPDSS